MFFSQPWLLLGAGLCVIPILIHLLSRRVAQREPWAAMRFLRAALERRSRQLRLESLLLLLVRTLLLLLLVLALAEPVFFAAGEMVASSAVHRILVVDLSASMGTVSDGERRIERLRREVDAILDQAAAGDRFQLVRIATLSPRTLIRQPTVQTEEVRAELARWDVTEERGDVEAGLQSVLELLRSPDEGLPREVILLSDWQRSNWQPDVAPARDAVARLLQRIGSAARLRLIDVSGPPTGNLAITQLQGNRALVVPQQPIELIGTVRNFGSSPTTARLEWLVQGRVEESALVEVAGLAETPVRYIARAPSDGPFDVELRLASDDPLAVDNRRFTTLPVRSALEVLVVDGRPGLRPIDGAGGFVALALSPPPTAGSSAAVSIPVHVTQLGDSQLADVDLSRHDCLWLCDVPGLDESTARRLTAYVENGGGVIVSVGEQTDADRWNEWRSTTGDPLLPALLRQPLDVLEARGNPVGLQLTTPPHEALKLFVGNPRAGLETTRVQRYFEVAVPSSARTETVLTFSDGSPAIVRHAVESGQVCLVLTSADDRWGNWAIWPSFLPLVHALTEEAALGATADRQLTVGDPLERRLPPSSRNSEASLTTPKGASLTLTPECTAEACRLRFEGTSSAGVYRLSADGWSRGAAVNVSESESSPVTLDEPALAQGLLKGTSFTFDQEWRAAAGQRANPAARGSLSGPLLATALLLLVVEKLLGWNSRVGVLALSLSGLAVAGWRTARINPWLAAALLLLIAAAGIVLRLRLRSPMWSGRVRR